MFKSLLVITCMLAVASAVYYDIKYTGYTDNTCSNVDSKVTGNIYAYTCATENRVAAKYTTGKVMNVNATHLTSCDYSDTQCTNLTVCVTYGNGACADSSSTDFSNKYTWVAKSGGGWDITYTSYTADGCKVGTEDAGHTGKITENKCAPEFTDAVPQSGKITYIDDYMLTSCDYVDTACTQLKLCENYTNSICYASEFTAFSNMYSWNASASATKAPTSAPSTPTSAPVTSAPATSAPATSAPAPANMGDWQITYTGYTDNVCNKVDNTVTGQIFAYTCAPEFRNAPQSGMITKISNTVLTSCDYSDTQCKTGILCEDYNNGQCYGSSTVNFSNKYTWTDNGQVIYTSYASKDCTGAQNVDSPSTITPMTCGLEFQKVPQSGKITQITADWLISCDYTGTTCSSSNVIVCENYTNHACYGSQVAAFSNMYSWTLKSSGSSGSNPTSLPVNGGAGQVSGSQATNGKGGNKDDWEIAYIAFGDNSCDKETFDSDKSGQIFAFTCAPEFVSSPSSGKIVYINDNFLRSCDYSDANCTIQTVCEDYNRSQCYNSGDRTTFSNRYDWQPKSTGGYTITYSSFKSRDCPASAVDLKGEIFQGVCAAENTNSKSGMITEIDEDRLVSCDYSDSNCKDLILCEEYNNQQCYGSPVTAFSNMYVWRRATSSASAISAAFSLGFAGLVALVMLF